VRTWRRRAHLLDALELKLLELRQYLYFCTSKASKASKVRTWRAHLLDALELKLLELRQYLYFCTSKASKASKVRTLRAHLLDALELKLLELWLRRVDSCCLLRVYHLHIDPQEAFIEP
jgi:hypothetical protein